MKLGVIRLITFFSAFLLFQIELIIGKIFLPNFGGSYMVWGACLVFFQAVLLLGYLYAHLIVERIGLDRYRYFHLILLCLPLITFPGHKLALRYALHPWPMVFDIFWHLSLTLGLAFFTLSTMSILWQAWLSRSDLPEKDNPYALFAVSNLGSFAALLTYPFVFEYYFDIEMQQNIWRMAYFFLIALQAIAVFVIKVIPREEVREGNVGSATWTELLVWFLYGAAGVMMFMAITNILTSEITPMPLLWVLPLAIYLLSFVLVFKRKKWCPAWIKEKFHLIVAFGMLFYFGPQIRQIIPLQLELVILVIILFFVCMFCQDELHSSRPSDAGKLTQYYLVIASGSFVGGVLVTWVLPLVTTSFQEYLVGFLILCFAYQLTFEREHLSFYHFRLIFYLLLTFLFWPVIFRDYHLTGILIIIMLLKIFYSELKDNPASLTLSVAIILCLSNILESTWSFHQYFYARRNYYGLSRIYDFGGVRYFLHGVTIHGAEYTSPRHQGIPLTYFSTSSPVGEVMTSTLFDFKRLALLGLGTGTLATYFKKDQFADYYELDHDVVKIAKKYFSFLNHAAGKINYVMGDARLSLEKSKVRDYDLIVVDVFSGDAIPVHLLTREAVRTYREHLTSKGLILFHLSNRYIEGRDVLAATASAEGAYVARKRGGNIQNGIFDSKWVAVTWDKEVASKLMDDLKWQTFPKDKIQGILAWTDKYSTLLPYFQWQSFTSSVKGFNFLRP